MKLKMKIVDNGISSKRILICGYGNIGQHLYKELESLKAKNLATIDIYDKYKNGLKNIDSNKNYDYMFICVPTEMKDDGSADIFAVEECVNEFTEVDTTIIKSAIPVGTCDKLNNLNIVVSPEYWGTTQHCAEPNFLILGGYRYATDKVVQLYNLIKNGYYKYYITDYKTAELVKYMENSWIAAKVTFCNEFAKIAEGFGVSYAELRELWLADSRVSPSHTLVYDDKPYYDSHCLNKDIPALISFCNKAKINTPFMQSVLDVNTNIKKSFE